MISYNNYEQSNNEACVLGQYTTPIFLYSRVVTIQCKNTHKSMQNVNAESPYRKSVCRKSVHKANIIEWIGLTKQGLQSSAYKAGLQSRTYGLIGL